MKHNRKILYLAGFLFAVPIALVSYINSTRLENFIERDYVGIAYAIASILSIIGLFKMPRILNRFGNRLTILLSLFSVFIAFFFLALANDAFIIIPAFALYFVSVGFIISSMDIYLEDFSKRSSIGTARGTYLTILSLSWVIAQVISGSVIDKISFSGLYLLAAFFILFSFLTIIFFLRDFKDPHYKKFSLIKTLKCFTLNAHISKIYLSNVILQFFYVWMVIYTPIYLNKNMGFEWSEIGIIFSIMLLPFVILDFPLGKLSDKIGEKKMLIGGFFIIALSVLSIPFIKAPSLLIWALALFMTRVGAATIETMNESYFFKIVTEEDSDEIFFFRNAPYLSYILASLSAIPVLLFTPSFEYLYFILSAILFAGLFLSLRIKDVIK